MSIKEILPFLWLSLLAFCFGGFVGSCTARSPFEREAVKHGAAYYATMPDGGSKWQWNDAKPETSK